MKKRSNSLRKASNRPTESNIEKEKEKEVVNLKDKVTKTLALKDPSYGKNRVFYNYYELGYKSIEEEENYITVLDLESSIMDKEDKKKYNEFIEYHKKKNKTKKNFTKDCKEFIDNEQDAIKSMRNQLTFAERTSQSINPPIISREIETLKLEKNNHSGILHKWDIFDKYLAIYITNEEKRKREEMLQNYGRIIPKEKKKSDDEKGGALSRSSLLKNLKLVEKQIMKILNGEAYYYYREWNKEKDLIDNKQIFMLLAFPHNANVRNRSVTALCWNPLYEDLFAVGYGSYNFPKKRDEKSDETNEKSDDTLEHGYIYVFSIKNNYYPEVRYTTDSGVLCLDFHPNEFSLLVAGMYDGTISVFDIKQKSKGPLITCDIRTQRHMDPVWQVRWYHLYNPGEYEFYSISSDGKVNRWSFFTNKNTLESEEIITLKYTENQNPDLMTGGTENINSNKGGEGDSATFTFGNAGGMCFDFNKHKGYENLFVLGTEEGHIYLCSVKHRGHYIQSYEGHTMGVYTVVWNPYHEKVFASCSADWTVKIWHYNILTPLIIFDLQNSVGNITWSPWCSVIFACVTVQGDIKFFDLNRDRKKAVHEKKYKEIPINHIAFNRYEYVFITGNEKGKVRLWRMAEALRSTIDKKEEEAKELEKKQKESNKNNLPETKQIVPRHLQTVLVRHKKIVDLKKENKAASINSVSFRKGERERVADFLRLLDIYDDK